MSGCLSVRFLSGFDPIAKVGGDEVIFKMHSMNESAWKMDSVKVISAKSEGKGNMKSVFNDDIVGLTGNSVTEKMMKDFQLKREKGCTFENPMFVE